jgi:hypothetical protein
MGAAVRVVLETLDDTRDAVLIAFEIDNPVTLLVPATLVAHRDAAIVIAAALGRLLVEQGSVGLAFVQPVGLYLNDKTASCGCRFRFMQRHDQ